MKVRAKFRVDQVSMQHAPWKESEGRKPVQYSVELTPVTGHSDPQSENAKFWDATPAGKISIVCANAEAAEGFKVGKAYYVDFSPAEG